MQHSVSDARTAVRPASTDWPRWFVIGAVVAGTFDICYATGFSYLRNGTPPSRILQFVASGLLGPASFQGGAATAILGLALHYLNAFLITAVLFAAVRVQPALVRRPILGGVLYGLVVYGVMNYVAMPLSRIGRRPTPPASVLFSGLLVHMFLIGVPMALAARRALARRS